MQRSGENLQRGGDRPTPGVPWIHVLTAKLFPIIHLVLCKAILFGYFGLGHRKTGNMVHN